MSFAAVADYEWYQKYQSNSESTILSIINDADDLFEFECNIKLSIENINIYTSSDDPFTVDFSNGSALLSELASYWDTAHSGTYVNVVCLFSNKSCPSCNYRGWAVCPGQFSAIRDGYCNYKILAHEIGHNLGATHDDAYNGSPTSIMYAHLNLPENNFWLTSANKSNISNEINNRLITYSYFEDNALCGNTTFSVSNIPSGFTVTWPKSSNLGFEGSSTGSPVTIKPVSNGVGWVEPTLTKGSQVIKFPKDEFWVGDPITPEITGNPYVDCSYSLFTDATMQSVTWSVYGPLQIVGPNQGYKCTVQGTGSGMG